MPLKALLEIGRTAAFCLIATEDDAFTYNDKVNGLSLIQEHGMIMRAIKLGVTAEQIAKALAVDVSKIKASMNLLDGIHADTVELLKDKPISVAALRLFRKAKADRQLDMAQLADCIRPLLAESEAAKFAVGYFFLSGFKLIHAELERLRELRLLIGNVSDARTIEHLAETHSAAQIIEQSRARQFANAREREAALQAVAGAMRERLSRLTQTDDDERLIRLLLRLLDEKRFKIRVYTQGRLHAKAYIF